MNLGADRVRVRVPATSGNLGPGFDALGMAYQLHDAVSVQVLPDDDEAPSVVVEVVGEGAGQVPLDERHLVVQALRRTLEVAGAPPVRLALQCHNAIPHGRGLGSSAAAVVAGIAAARALLAQPGVLSDRDVLELATEFEGHPDNAAPAIYGGATVAWTAADGKPHAAPLPVAADIVPTLLVPQAHLATAEARAALPPQVPLADAAFNAGRAALLVHALAQAPDLLLDATADRLHQDYRAEAYRPSWELVQRLREAGYAAVISGAGPTVLVLSDASQLAELDRVLTQMIGGEPKAQWQQLRPGIDRRGVRADAGSDQANTAR